MVELFGNGLLGKMANNNIRRIPISSNSSSENTVDSLSKSSEEIEAMKYLNSSIIPIEFNTVQDIMLILDFTKKTGLPISAVANNLVAYDRRVGWKSSFIIGLINNCKKFKEDLRFVEVGQKGTDDWGFFAKTVDLKDNVLTSQPITIGLAKEEGWYSKKGSKWQVMPEQMMMYRAAAFFSRLYIPDVLCGLLSQEELYDISQVVDKEFLEEKVQVEKEEAPKKRSTLKKDTPIQEKFQTNSLFEVNSNVVTPEVKETHVVESKEEVSTKKDKTRYVFSKELLEMCEQVMDYGFKASEVLVFKEQYFIELKSLHNEPDVECLKELQYFSYSEKKKVWYRDVSNDLEWY